MRPRPSWRCWRGPAPSPGATGPGTARCCCGRAATPGAFHCLPFGTELPLLDIGHAAAAHRAEVVALSFSAAYPARQLPEVLARLRGLLPPGVALWAGGAGVARAALAEGVTLLPGLADGVTALRAWRAAHP